MVVEIKRYDVTVQRDVFLALNIAAAISMAVLVILFLHLTHKVSNQSTEIQHQRIESITRSCRDQNARHDRTILALRVIVHRLEIQQPAKKAQLENALKQNELLINALAPRQNCLVVVARAVPTTTIESGG